MHFKYVVRAFRMVTALSSVLTVAAEAYSFRFQFPLTTPHNEFHKCTQTNSGTLLTCTCTSSSCLNKHHHLPLGMFNHHSSFAQTRQKSIVRVSFNHKSGYAGSPCMMTGTGTSNFFFPEKSAILPPLVQAGIGEHHVLNRAILRTHL